MLELVGASLSPTPHEGSDSSMGLAERRASKQFQETIYPDLKAAIDQAAGFEVTIAVDWESLALEDQAELYGEAWTKVFFEPLRMAIEAVCIDDLGRDALKVGLQGIQVGDQGQNSVSFAAGVLSISFAATTNLAYGADRAKEIQVCLEKGL
jgi:hypothetical protein